MDRREEALQWVEKQLWSINTDNGYPISVDVVSRGPTEPFVRFPAVALFELEDRVSEAPRNNGVPVCGRTLELYLEFWVVDSGGMDAVARMRHCIRWVLFAVPPPKGMQLEEKSMTPIIKPVMGKHEVVGQGISFVLRYADMITDPRG